MLMTYTPLAAGDLKRAHASRGPLDNLYCSTGNSVLTARLTGAILESPSPFGPGARALAAPRSRTSSCLTGIRNHVALERRPT